MTFLDIKLLGKKILIGVIVTIVPFLILFGGLWLTKKILSDKKTEPVTTNANPKQP